MKYLPILLAILFNIQMIFAQKISSKDIFKKKVINGFNTQAEDSINALKYYFPNKIKFALIDSNNVATIEISDIKSNKNLLRFDLNQGEINWQLSYKTPNISYTQDSLFLYQISPEGTTSFNLKDGQLNWKSNTIIDHIDSKNDLAIGGKLIGNYNPNSEKLDKKTLNPITYAETLEFRKKINFLFSSDSLFGINLLNGKQIWRRKINSFDEIDNEHFLLNDSTLIISKAGIHRINTKTGDGWDYKLRTSKSAVNKKTKLVGGINVNLSAKKNQFTFEGVFSNILLDDSLNYFMAGANKMVSLNHDGQINWETPLNKEIMSSSQLAYIGDMIILLNSGYAYNYGLPVKCGVPFLMAFNPKNGKTIYASPIKTKDVIRHAIIVFEENLLIIADENILQYNIQTGQLIKSIKVGELNPKKHPLLSLSDNIFIKEGNQYKPINYSDIELINLFQKNTLYSINEDLSIKYKSTLEDLWFFKFTYKEYIFLSQKNKIVILDPFLNVVAENILGTPIDIKEEKLYTIHLNNLYEIDLRKIIKNTSSN